MPRTTSPRRIRSISSTLLAALTAMSACSVGPNYVRPSAPMAPAFKETEGWKVAEPRDDVARGPWWEIYGDPDLNDLVAQVNVSNQSLQTAEAQFRQARTMVWEARSSWYPTASVAVSATRRRTSSTLTNNFPGGTQTDLSTPLGISWELDVWGRIRRLVESNNASAQASAADVESTRLSLQAELAADYFQLRALDADRQILDQSVDAFEKSLQLTQSRFEGGVASRADVALAETQLETTQAQAIDLGVQRAQLEHAIAVLIGLPASSFSIPPQPLTQTPPAVPVGVPSELLERRPDVASAERLVASANAQIGVAVAAYYPTVTLSADGGFESGHFSDWFTWPSRIWSIGPSVSETVFDGGLRAAQTSQARAAYDGNVASYRQSVLVAFQEVEDNLAALRILEEESHVLDQAVTSALDSVRLTTNRYKEGTASYLDVVVTQTTALNNQRSAVDVLGRRMVANVQLIQALGGGWNASDLPTGHDLSADRPLI
jgi:NodT family efflux transporter outer membrane factor (OMF) lipoprotein